VIYLCIYYVRTTKCTWPRVASDVSRPTCTVHERTCTCPVRQTRQNALLTCFPVRTSHHRRCWCNECRCVTPLQHSWCGTVKTTVLQYPAIPMRPHCNLGTNSSPTFARPPVGCSWRWRFPQENEEQRSEPRHTGSCGAVDEGGRQRLDDYARKNGWLWWWRR
jgi:hypothetical protein